jgi:hypothetical protein
VAAAESLSGIDFMLQTAISPRIQFGSSGMATGGFAISALPTIRVWLTKIVSFQETKMGKSAGESVVALKAGNNLAFLSSVPATLCHLFLKLRQVPRCASTKYSV